MTTARAPHLEASVRRGALADALAAVRSELDLPDGFAPEVLAEADRAVRDYRAPDRDLRGLPFVTIDPVGSLDLDQAFAIERSGTGHLVRYAIADVPGFVAPGGALDAETRRRGQTLYGAEDRVPLHPDPIAEDAASLLPDVDRGAWVWEFALDADGALTRSDLVRALVRSRARLDYAGAQAALDAGRDAEPLELLREVGLARIRQEEARGGASLNTPDIEVERTGELGYGLVRRAPLPIEEWNAQLSLLTGIAGASIMLAGRVGVLRTMPEAEPAAIADFRRRAAALGRPWPQDVRYGDYLRGLDRDDPAVLAVLDAAAGLFRGAGYTVFDGEAPEHPVQAALAAPYAHVTAPLRRLVDRWGLAICAHLVAGGDRGDEEIAWAVSSLGELPEAMRSSSRRASQWQGSSVARIEAAVLADRIGETFTATVLELRGSTAELQLADPAVTARGAAAADWRPGTLVQVVLEAADIATGAVRFAAA